MNHDSTRSRPVNDVYQRKLKDIMSRDVVTISAGDNIHNALALMGENRVSALPVVNHQNQCIGILSTSDLVDMTRDVDDDLYHLDLVDPTSRRFLLDKLAHSLGNESVQSFMSDAVTVADLDTSIGKALREMLKNRVHHLPVVDKKGTVLGIVSTMDVLAEFADAAPEFHD